MSKREFEVEIRVVVRLSDKVLAVASDADWQEMFYSLTTPEDVAEHIAFNRVQGRELSQLDGFADLSNDDAVVLDINVVEAVELEYE